jgi:hypothetical protein
VSRHHTHFSNRGQQNIVKREYDIIDLDAREFVIFLAIDVPNTYNTQEVSEIIEESDPTRASDFLKNEDDLPGAGRFDSDPAA